MELIRMIDNLSLLDTTTLDVPLSKEMSLLLSEMFTESRKACGAVLKNYISQAEEDGSKFTKKFKENKHVENYLS